MISCSGAHLLLLYLGRRCHWLTVSGYRGTAQGSLKALVAMEKHLAAVKSWKVGLAQYLCEDPACMSLHKLLNTLAVSSKPLKHQPHMRHEKKDNKTWEGKEELPDEV
ncbi:hypothetical protein AGIG_G15335 [Arapaima gigas]